MPLFRASHGQICSFAKGSTDNVVHPHIESNAYFSPVKKERKALLINDTLRAVLLSLKQKQI